MKCMNDLGMDNPPGSSSDASGQNNSGQVSSDTPLNLDDPEWVSQHGYGIVERYRVGGAEDPNQNFEQIIAVADKPYYLALYGPLFFVKDPDKVTYDWKEGGCNGKAKHEVKPVNLLELPQFSGLNKQIEDFWATQESSPAYNTLYQGWSSCMAKAGFPGLVKQADASPSIFAKVKALYAKNTHLDAKTDPELAKLSQEEIRLATQDLRCQQRSDYKKQALKIRFSLEQKFIDGHHAELQALKTVGLKNS